MRTYISPSGDIYYNLALEYFLAMEYGKTSNVLYLWSNNSAVVIGAHQIAAREVNTALLFKEKGKLARRYSGGGAVYHDRHNLCFSFICPKERCFVEQNYDIILNALRSFDVVAYRSGRNDLEWQGKKFSGNAFYTKEGVTVHHGTLLIDTDFCAMERYLNADREKLQGHGVKSVSSRVVNLKSVNGKITKAALIREIFSYAKKEGAIPIKLTVKDKKQIALYKENFKSEKWLFDFEKYSYTLQGRFIWGGVQINYEVQKGKITQLRIYTDCLDTEEIERVREKLIGQNPLAFIQEEGEIYNDVISLFN